MSIDERSLMIAGPFGQIEAILCEVTCKSSSDKPRVAVLCHPHPLYGGTMDNKVVSTLARVYHDLGITTLRFNFRGVGGSEGAHADAIGEVDDLCFLSEWLMSRYPEAQLLLAGFSFGSAIAAAASERLPVMHMVLVAPPVTRYSFATEGSFTCPVVLVLGGQDELVNGESVRLWMSQLQSPVEEILLSEASHFFHGQLIALRESLAVALKQALN